MTLKLFLLELLLIASSHPQFCEFHCDVEKIVIHLKSQLKVQGINLFIRKNSNDGKTKLVSDLFKSTLARHQSVYSVNKISRRKFNSTENCPIFFISASVNPTELEKVVKIYRKTAIKSSLPKIIYTIISTTNHTDFKQAFNFFFKKFIVDVIVLEVLMQERKCSFQVHQYNPLSKVYSKCNFPKTSIKFNEQLKNLHGQRFYLRKSKKYFRKILDHVKNVSTNFNTYEAKYPMVDVLLMMNATIIRTTEMRKCMQPNHLCAVEQPCQLWFNKLLNNALKPNKVMGWVVVVPTSYRHITLFNFQSLLIAAVIFLCNLIIWLYTRSALKYKKDAWSYFEIFRLINNLSSAAKITKSAELFLFCTLVISGLAVSDEVFTAISKLTLPRKELNSIDSAREVCNLNMTLFSIRGWCIKSMRAVCEKNMTVIKDPSYTLDQCCSDTETLRNIVCIAYEKRVAQVTSYHRNGKIVEVNRNVTYFPFTITIHSSCTSNFNPYYNVMSDLSWRLLETFNDLVYRYHHSSITTRITPSDDNDYDYENSENIVFLVTLLIFGMTLSLFILTLELHV